MRGGEPEWPVLAGSTPASLSASAVWTAPLPASLPWNVPPLPMSGDQQLVWFGAEREGSDPRIGTAKPLDLARLQAAPLNPMANPLLLAGPNANLDDGLRLALAPAPEPQSWAMFITGMLLVGGQLRRRQRGRSYLATL
jgi:hypothetical protein